VTGKNEYEKDGVRDGTNIPAKRAAAIDLASRDPRFFIETFCWRFDPNETPMPEQEDATDDFY
jgi:hypothetical protein